MELERDEIIEALERNIRLSLDLNYGFPRITYSRLRDVVALIKQLTQANEMLSESYDHLEKTKDELLAERSRLTEENERLRAENEMLLNIKKLNLDKVIADTVRKMYERLKAQKFTHKNFGELVYVEDIDQIAKEMLEGDDG